MKPIHLTTALVACLALPALAQDAASPFQTEPMGPSISATDVIGARIYVSEAEVDADAYNGVQQGWNDIGEVNDIILGRDGTVDAVLVDIGGFLGMGERQVAVDMAALRVVQDDATDADDWFLVLQTDRATLEGAPEYVIPGMATDAAASTDPAAADPAATDAAMADPAATATTDTPAATDGMSADGAMTLPEGYAAVDQTALTAELLTGADVRDSTDASIAEVQDLVLTTEGQVTDVVLDVGGFLGIGAKRVAIPMDRLTVAQGEGGAVRLWVNMTKQELEALPEYQM
ncbi:PRC-barrel domain-containing protein [Tabrizicola sp.]|uniref:PRC-barrel domain-containing protein n=1 Tax=Tabrizicola sp. TaxID=2005166 RepID=UPI001A4A51EA|nr:PRC-barrel domain-containing protein [Tabrizicola sp.]MBL9072773.1 PRC-barrel domain-containing protein [Tabrizicola sp.]